MVVDLDKQADDLADKKKAIDAQAKTIRDEIMRKLQSAKLTSATHESGYRATIVTPKPKFAVVDLPAAIKSIKKAKMNALLSEVPEQVIKAHTEVNLAVFEPWYKAAGESAKALISGVEEKEAKPYLRIAKGDEE
jgi:hypothetical protein